MNQQLEHYFDVLDPLDIRIGGSRIGIDDVLRHYFAGESIATIREAYPSLTCEQIAATILFYEQNQAEIDQYLQELDAWRETRRRESHEAAKSWPGIQRIQAALFFIDSGNGVQYAPDDHLRRGDLVLVDGVAHTRVEPQRYVGAEVM